MMEGEGGRTRVRRAAARKAGESRHAGAAHATADVGGNIQGLPACYLIPHRGQPSCHARSSCHIEQRGRDPSIRPVPAAAASGLFQVVQS